jgi:essential nuclear protein 1
MPRVQKPSKPRHDPLHVEIEADSSVRQFGRVTKPGKRRAREDEQVEEGVGLFVPPFDV